MGTRAWCPYPMSAGMGFTRVRVRVRVKLPVTNPIGISGHMVVVDWIIACVDFNIHVTYSHDSWSQNILSHQFRRSSCTMWPRRNDNRNKDDEGHGMTRARARAGGIVPSKRYVFC